MGRKTQQNDITSPELLKQINLENKKLMTDYLSYLSSIQRSENTIKSYKSDLEIFFVWNLQNNKDKFFTDVTKRNIVSYQSWLLNNNKNSPARIRRLKSTLSSLSNYIEAVLDDEYPNFRSIIKKIESPVNQKVLDKTVLSDEQCEVLLKHLCENKKYEKACMFALATCSGRRKSELVRFKVSYFDDSNIFCGSLYKTPEKIVTKGRGGGKPLTCYTLRAEFKPYLDLWMSERINLEIESEWLFPDHKNPKEHLNSNTLNSWATGWGKILKTDVYIHALRHYFVTHLKRLGLPDDVIQEVLGWSSVDMVKVYNDLEAEDSFKDYFGENGIKETKTANLSDL